MAPYRHFADKAELLAAICEAGFSQFAGALERARQNASPDFASRMNAMAVAYVRFASEHRAHFEVMFGAGAESAVKSARESLSGRRAFEILEKTIREGQETGDVRSGDSAQLARIAWALVHGISMLELETQAKKRGTKAEFTLFASTILLTGLRPATRA
jgi:AcrR family transcriptional regulator